jgi:hypothetical protein
MKIIVLWCLSLLIISKVLKINYKISIRINPKMKLFRNFSSTASSFKSRSKLTEFYKLTHPDILNNAPVK